MNVQIETSGLQLTNELEEYINKKVEILERFVTNVNPEPVLHLHFKRFSNKQTGKIFELHASITVNGTVIAFEDQASEEHELIDLVETKLKRALRRGKAKTIGVKRQRDLRNKISQRFSRLLGRQ